MITTGGTATVTLTTLPFDYDLKVLNSCRYTARYFTGTAAPPVKALAEPTLRAPTMHRYMVRMGLIAQPTCYTLRVQLGTASRGGDLITSDVQKVDVFPNPVNNIVNINLTGYTGKSDLSLFDVNGRMVINRQVSTTNTPLDISALPAGVYMLRIKNGGKEVKMKIIKQ